MGERKPLARRSEKKREESGSENEGEDGRNECEGIGKEKRKERERRSVRRGGDGIKCLVNAGERERGGKFRIKCGGHEWSSVAFHFKGEFKNYSLIRVI
jgi:hypothetical protein